MEETSAEVNLRDLDRGRPSLQNGEKRKVTRSLVSHYGGPRGLFHPLPLRSSSSSRLAKGLRARRGAGPGRVGGADGAVGGLCALLAPALSAGGPAGPRGRAGGGGEPRGRETPREPGEGPGGLFGGRVTEIGGSGSSAESRTAPARTSVCSGWHRWLALERRPGCKKTHNRTACALWPGARKGPHAWPRGRGGGLCSPVSKPQPLRQRPPEGRSLGRAQDRSSAGSSGSGQPALPGTPGPTCCRLGLGGLDELPEKRVCPRGGGASGAMGPETALGSCGEAASCLSSRPRLAPGGPGPVTALLCGSCRPRLYPLFPVGQP